MTNAEKEQYTDMVDDMFDDDGRITEKGRHILMATFLNVDKLCANSNKLSEALSLLVG